MQVKHHSSAQSLQPEPACAMYTYIVNAMYDQEHQTAKQQTVTSPASDQDDENEQADDNRDIKNEQIDEGGVDENQQIDDKRYEVVNVVEDEEEKVDSQEDEDEEMPDMENKDD